MKSMQWRICAWAALAPLTFAVHAATIDPSSATADVPAAAYESAFKTYRPVAEESTSPDKGWRAANDAVAAKPGEDHMMGMQMGGSMNMSMPGKTDMPASAGKMMVMPDGTTMPIEKHKSMPMGKETKMPMDHDMKMPMPKVNKSTPAAKSTDKQMNHDMNMPMPKGDASMPGMDMSHGDHGKGH